MLYAPRMLMTLLTLSCATHAVFERASPLFFELFLAERYLVSNQELNM